jgi:hypothetical protein
MTETAALPRAPIDVSKHVNFTLGMVLGVDDFDQEFAYLSARDRWLARDLHGYGTTSGLAVTIEIDDQQRGPRVNVAPGAAVTPCGHLVCVSPAQCAYLNEWLASNLEQVRTVLADRPQLSPPGGTLPLYVVLCYADCPTDDLPIPGEPCRTEDSLSQPSRVKDDFRLELRTTRPRQQEEDAVRDLVRWLRLIPIVNGPGSTTDELLGALRDAVALAPEAHGSPPGTDADFPYDFVLGLPAPDLVFGADELVEQLRALLRVWVTELRPVARQGVPGCAQSCSGGCGCGSGGSIDCGCGSGFGPGGPNKGDCGGACCDAVLLAEVEVSVVEDLDGSLVVADDGWRVDASERPYLLHTRLLQELLLTGATIPVFESPPSGGALGPPIAAVTASQVVGSPTATWDSTTRTLDLGIPAGVGVDSVVVTQLPPGTPPAAISFTGGVLTLGLANGQDGSPGPGIAQVNAVGLPSGTAPTATLVGQVLTLGIPKGDPGPSGTSAGPGRVVAAGSFGSQGGVNWSFPNDLTAQPITGFPGLYFVNFEGLGKVVKEGRYVLSGTAVTDVNDPAHTVEVVRRDPPRDSEEEKALIAVIAQIGPGWENGLIIRAFGVDKESPTDGFMLEITDYQP